MGTKIIKGVEVQTRRIIFVPKGKYGRSRTKVFLLMRHVADYLTVNEISDLSGVSFNYIKNRAREFVNLGYFERRPELSGYRWVSTYQLTGKALKNLASVESRYPDYVQELIHEINMVNGANNEDQPS